MRRPYPQEWVRAVEKHRAGLVDELGTCRRREGLEPLAEGLLHLLEDHTSTVVRRADRWRKKMAISTVDVNRERLDFLG